MNVHFELKYFPRVHRRYPLLMYLSPNFPRGSPVMGDPKVRSVLSHHRATASRSHNSRMWSRQITLQLGLLYNCIRLADNANVYLLFNHRVRCRPDGSDNKL